MELVLVRHAQPEWNRGRAAQVDPRLTELGQAQAEQLAACMAGERFDEVLVSTARRARRTAAPVVEAVDAPLGQFVAQTDRHTRVEVPERLTAGHALPPGVPWPLACFAQGPADLLGGAALPRRRHVDLVQPRAVLDDRGWRSSQERRRGPL